MITPEVLFFLRDHPAVLPLYEELDRRIFAEFPDVLVRVQKTQITFSNQHGFAFISFLPVRPAARRPKEFLTLSLGLGRRLDSLRVDQATEPYPGRWTNHILLTAPEDVDEELMGWIREAAAFAAAKRPRRQHQHQHSGPEA